MSLFNLYPKAQDANLWIMLYSLFFIFNLKVEISLRICQAFAETRQVPRSGVAGWAKAPPIFFAQYLCLH